MPPRCSATSPDRSLRSSATSELADIAKRRLDALGYQNVKVRNGDGTKGWPEEAPFDAIIVTAGGPAAPAALKEPARHRRQAYHSGGHESRRSQRLVRITRVAAAKFDEEDLGGVVFVPLISEQGWADDRSSGLRARRPPG